MTTQVLVPVMGEAIGEARLITWLKQAGEPVRRGDELAELETDKATLMLECPADGVLLEILVAPGAMVATGELLARVGRPGESAPIETEAAALADTENQVERHPVSSFPAAAVGEEPRLRISPAARRMARSMGIDINQITPSKPGARITTEDVARFAASPVQPAGSRVSIPHHRERLSDAQRTMAARMAQSAREIPQFSVAVEADVTRLQQVKQELSSRGGAFSLTTLLIHLTARALTRFPLLNARYDAEAAIVFETVNMAVAVASPHGLTVPVLHSVEQLGLDVLANRWTALAQTARDGRLSLAQVSDGTFTLTNLGMYGVSQFVPLVNPPQAAILGVGAARSGVWPTAEGTRHSQRMTLTVSADHRLVDGAYAARFLGDLRREIEEATLF